MLNQVLNFTRNLSMSTLFVKHILCSFYRMVSIVVCMCDVSLFSMFFQAPQSPLTQPPPSLSLRLPRFTRVQAHSLCPLLPPQISTHILCPAKNGPSRQNISFINGFYQHFYTSSQVNLTVDFSHPTSTCLACFKRTKMRNPR